MNTHSIGTSCPVCGYNVPTAFFNPGDHPLATLGWPKTAAEAMNMPTQTLDFVQCPSCTHVWNRAFNAECIPYQENPNRMFNNGGIWSGHLAKTRDLLLAEMPDNPTVIDVGCGEGHFVRGLGEALRGSGRMMGFDLNAANETGIGIEFHQRYFDPLIDMKTFNPHVVVMRHVIEHMEKPAQFIDQLAWGAKQQDHPCLLFVEVPCIDKVFTTERLADFFYEHVSHFTTRSFTQLISRAGNIKHLGHGYGEEVIFALIELDLEPNIAEQEKTATRFNQRADASIREIKQQLEILRDSGETVAIWGGTGKAAAFMQYFCVEPSDFPIVVDSDESKIGTFVPGQGQEIVSPQVLKGADLGVVIIPSQWRAKDITKEMAALGISPERVLIEHEGTLVDFHKGLHPYL